MHLREREELMFSAPTCAEENCHDAELWQLVGKCVKEIPHGRVPFGLLTIAGYHCGGCGNGQRRCAVMAGPTAV